MSSLPMSICICSIEITDDDVIAHRDRNHCNENHRLCAQTPVKLFKPFDSHRPCLIWNHSYQLKMFQLKLIPHFTQFTSNLNLHTNSHVTFLFLFFWSPFVLFCVLCAIQDGFKQCGEVCTKSSISFRIKTICIFLYCIIIITINILF